MEEFDTDEILRDLQTLEFSVDAKEKLEKLRQSIHYTAPELIGQLFFNGYKSTTGLCEILQNYTTDELKNRVDEKYENIVSKYSAWEKERKKKSNT